MARSIFDQALLDEGILGTPLEALARSVYSQESNSGKNTATSNAGAVGGMQIIPSTFRSVADQGWSITDPYYNARAGIRYLKQGNEATGGDPQLTAAYYYGGPGGAKKLANGIAVADPRNPNAPTTAQYADQVLGRAKNFTIGSNMPTPPNPNDSSQAILNQVIQPPQSGDGILDKIANRPGLSEALIGMGAGLLSQTGTSNPLANGLAKGFQGFNAGMSTGIENAKARVVPIAGGAFSQITHPDGRVEIVPNTEAQKFLRDQAQLKSESAMRLQQYKYDNAPLTPGEQRDLRELDQGISSADRGIIEANNVKTQLNDPKVSQALRQAGDLPFGQAIMGALGMDEATVNQRLESLRVEAWLTSSAKLKGAISDAENKRLNAPLPKLSDSAKVWNEFIDQRVKDLQTMREGLQRVRDTDYRRGGKPPEAPSAPKAPDANPVPPAGKVESAPLAPVGGGSNDDPLGLNLKKR